MRNALITIALIAGAYCLVGYQDPSVMSKCETHHSHETCFYMLNR
jgi:hypothetical protein